ncbi:MAG: hypothetical protein ACREHD_24875 [Pirellulales bacterium]
MACNAGPRRGISLALLVLGIERTDGTYIGAPRGNMELLPGDTLILYGPHRNLEDLDRRRAGHAGNWAHVMAVEEHLQIKAEEAELDRENAAQTR